ncbi:hypothetical protein HAX54_014190 [Datura stramonium]|uniref:Uncharacterized protein n=1 Tax=Datura stramonium TaxID=4076 RepID=A0ABS8TPI0_DATST|nr:hypothetical protein [Datura stramonium]
MLAAFLCKSFGMLQMTKPAIEATLYLQQVSFSYLVIENTLMVAKDSPWSFLHNILGTPLIISLRSRSPQRKYVADWIVGSNVDTPMDPTLNVDTPMDPTLKFSKDDDLSDSGRLVHGPVAGSL